MESKDEQLTSLLKTLLKSNPSIVNRHKLNLIRERSDLIFFDGGLSLSQSCKNLISEDFESLVKLVSFIHEEIESESSKNTQTVKDRAALLLFLQFTGVYELKLPLKAEFIEILN